jgi:hypothetical protein
VKADVSAAGRRTPGRAALDEKRYSGRSTRARLPDRLGGGIRTRDPSAYRARRFDSDARGVGAHARRGRSTRIDGREGNMSIITILIIIILVLLALYLFRRVV